MAEILAQALDDCRPLLADPRSDRLYRGEVRRRLEALVDELEQVLRMLDELPGPHRRARRPPRIGAVPARELPDEDWP